MRVLVAEDHQSLARSIADGLAMKALPSTSPSTAKRLRPSPARTSTT